MGCGYSVFSSQDDIIFKHLGPSGTPQKVFRVFDKENGLLFRILMKDGRWAFYNDTKEYEFHIQYTFDEESNITALGETTIVELENGSPVAELIVYPLETQMFVDGDFSRGEGRIEARPLSERYRREKVKEKLSRKK